MFLFGLLYYLAFYFITGLFDGYLTEIILWVITGLFVNKVYLFHAKSKIQSIKAKNPGKSIDELKGICTNKGGASYLSVLFGFIIAVAVALLISLAQMFLNIGVLVGKFGKSINKDIDNISKNKENTKYNGMYFADTSIKITDEYTITVPEEFQNLSTDYSYNYVNDSGKETFNRCEFKFEIKPDAIP